MHTHLSQLPAEVEAVKARSGLTPPQLLDKLGLLNERLIAAHCIHMDRADIELCGKAKMTVAHAPIGNAKGGRIAPIMELREAGARIALCTDTFSGDLIEAMRWAISMQRINRQGNVLDARTVLDWGNARGRRGASASPTRWARWRSASAPTSCCSTTRSPSLAPLVDGYGVLVHSASGHDVDTVIVDGRVVLSGGRAHPGGRRCHRRARTEGRQRPVAARRPRTRSARLPP